MTVSPRREFLYMRVWLNERMSRCLRPFTFVAAICATDFAYLNAIAACGTKLTPAENHFDGVDRFGHVALWEELGKLELQSSESLPVYITFSSLRGVNSPYLGWGWKIPILESRIIPVDENRFFFAEPFGSISSLTRDRQNPLLLSSGEKWKGRQAGAIVDLWTPCGWNASFLNGRLTRLKTPEGRVLDFLPKTGEIQTISEHGQSLLAISQHDDEVTVSMFAAAPTQVVFRLQACDEALPSPHFQAVHDRRTTLKSISSAGAEIAKFALQRKSDQRLELKRFGAADTTREMTWNQATGYIVSDGTWQYHIAGGEASSNPSIERVDNSGNSEFWHDNLKTGEETIRAIDGVLSITARHLAGPLRGKIKGIETNASGAVTKRAYSYDSAQRLQTVTLTSAVDPEPVVIEKYSYAESGLPLEVLRDGICYVYDQRGRLASASKEGNILWTIESAHTPTKYLFNGAIPAFE